MKEEFYIAFFKDKLTSLFIRSSKNRYKQLKTTHTKKMFCGA